MTSYAPELNGGQQKDEAYAPETAGRSSGEGQLLKEWEEKLQRSRGARRPYEGTWRLCEKYLAGKQWVALTDRGTRVIPLEEIDEWADRTMITVNVLTRYVWTAVGKIVADDLCPQFTFLAESRQAQEYSNQANRSWKFGYDQEIRGDRQVTAAILKMLCFGTAGIRARYDFGVGPVKAELPVDGEGQFITYDMEEARAVMAEAMQHGVQLELKPIRAGVLAWDVYDPRELYPPPGIEDESRFPYFILGRCVSIDDLKLIYPEKAADLTEESLTESGRMGSMRDAGGETDQSSGRIFGHTMLYTGFHKPTTEKPDGCVITWTQKRVLDYVKTLPYEICGRKEFGIEFLKWRPIPGRFWAQGMVEPAIGPQFALNRSVSQYDELKDMNLGRVFVTKGTITGVNRPQGLPMEIIELAPGAPPPVETQGVPPGPWIAQEAEMMKAHIADVVGMGGASVGQAPRGVSAYSAFAFLVEQDDKDVISAAKDLRDRAATLAHYSIQDIRRFWGQDKQIMLSGPDDQMQQYVFDATQIPAEYVVQAQKIVGIPHVQSAEIQKVFDIFDRSVSSGRPLPLDWLSDSLNAGRPLPLPKSQDATQRQKAELENMLLAQGQIMPPAPEDDDEAHVNVHVAGKVSHQMIPGQEMVVGAFDQHIQMHIMNAQQKMQASALATQEAAGNAGPKFENQAAPAGAAQPPIA